MQPELITLNLIYDYPVRWSKYKVLRDLVQNFYDSVTHHEWYKRFSHHHDGDGIVFTAQDVAFSYDWLIHIGASTKREKPGEYAGYFGEGFKIAALCALRDFGWRIEMTSQDWLLQVVTSHVVVDGRKLTSLAYQVWKNEDDGPNTTLRIAPFSADDAQLLADFFREVEVPACKIIKHDAASWQGMANCIPLKKPIRVSSRLQIRYRLSHIALKGSLLIEGEFGVVLSTYLHEIAHMFGVEGSASFSRALTELLEITLRNTKLIEHYRAQWYTLASLK